MSGRRRGGGRIKGSGVGEGAEIEEEVDEIHFPHLGRYEDVLLREPFRRRDPVEPFVSSGHGKKGRRDLRLSANMHERFRLVSFCRLVL